MFDHCLPCLDGFGDYQLSRYYLSINIDIRNKDQIVHRLSAVRAHFFRRKRSTCVLVAGPSELKIVDAKGQSAHHRKDAGRQRGLAQHAVYLQRERCYAGRGGHSIFPRRHSRQWWDTLYPNYTVRMASHIKQTKNVHPKYTKIFSKQCSK